MGFFVIFFLIISITIFLVHNAKDLKLNLYDSILSNNLGFSSFSRLGGNGSISQKTFRLISKLPDIFHSFVFHVYDDSFEKVYLNIKFKNYRFLLDDRKRSLKNKIGSNFSKVSGSILYRNKQVKAEFRLKGDLSDHWRSERRMSFRVRVKGSNYVHGFKVFSLQKPSSRQFPYDHIFQNLQQKIGNLSSSHGYIHLFVNGEDWGIMNIEEHMSKELLEKQHKKESIIVKFGNEKKWFYETVSDNPYEHYMLSDDKLNIKVYSDKKYLKEMLHRKWYSYIAKKHINGDLDLYDEYSFMTSLILAMSSGTGHVLDYGNARYFFNPYTLKIEPITTDQADFRKLSSPIEIANLYKKIASEAYKEKYYKLVKELLYNNAKSVFSQIQSTFPLDEEIDESIMVENFALLEKSLKDYIKKDTVKFVGNILPTNKQAADFNDHLYARHYSDGTIKIYNLLPSDIKILKIIVDGKVVKKNLVVNGYRRENRYDPVVLKTNLTGIFDNKIKIESSYKGYERSYLLGYTYVTRDIHNPLLVKNTYKPKWLLNAKQNGKNGWYIKKGEWIVKKPLIIKGNLNIEKGVKLKFDEDSFLIVNGNLRAVGTVDNKIYLKANHKVWKGMYVLNGSSNSILENVVVSDTKSLSDGILSLSGGVTFYNSNIKIINSIFKKSRAEDALNIVRSNYTLDNVRIDSSISDGFDSDFSSGLIINSEIFSVNGDGLDFSGSNATIKNTNFYDVHDKAISAGESSLFKY